VGAEFTVDLPPPGMVRALVRPEGSGRNRVLVQFPDGTIFDERLPTPERWRKGKITSDEVGRFRALESLCVRKVGDGYLPRAYRGKWVKEAVKRWADFYRRRKPERLVNSRAERAKAKSKRIREEHIMAALVRKERSDLTTTRDVAKEVAKRLGRKSWRVIETRIPEK
jgi:hypothetical protein